MLNATCRLAGISILLGLFGCSSQDVDSNQIANAQQGYDDASELVESGSYAEALPILDQVLADPGLDPDQAATALLMRAVCYAESGDTAAAEADIQEAEMGGPPDGWLNFAKAAVAEKNGDASAAKKLYSKARRLNPALKKP
ncbi:MAG TPA: hypothetical protein DDW52_28375 [Planctomycetaceae bacterium]|nr:hypothetical protein [Planctomycetaceae bacterium]